ncbi:MAG: PD-(D/E)XK nuclease family protein [Actinomycetaceae bacterium]|nr:PD-(D/E)XK nuclease family protein [Actinomycetaceae bacterium]MDY5854618.1 PD-(D/E)XK nuclease family protein [Arcanobacterium sp.]
MTTNMGEAESWQLPWDESQQAVLEACTPPAVLSVIGGPGTGKTSVLKACVGKILTLYPESRIAVLVPDRRAAGRLRNELSVALGGIGENVAVKSVVAFAFATVSHFAQIYGRREPELMAGPDQDVLIKDIFALAQEGYIPQLGTEVLAELGISPRATQLPAFRAEIRDLITRAAELDMSKEELERLAARHRRDIWALGAQVAQQYEGALATQASAAKDSPDRIDHARVITRAAAALSAWARAPQNAANVGKEEDFAHIPHWDFVFIDDVHNATLAVRSLLSALRQGGTSVVTFGNPDQGVQNYRGGIAQLPVILTKSPGAGGIGATELTLRVNYRTHGSLARVVEAVTEGIPTAGVSRHRRPFVAEELRARSDHSLAATHDLSASEENPLPTAERCSAAPENYGDGKGDYLANAGASAQAAELESAAEQEQTAGQARAAERKPDTHVAALSFPGETQELAYIARTARELHLLHGVAYSDIAVLTRSRAEHTAVRAGFVRYGVPVQAETPDAPLREQPATAALLACAQLAIADLEKVTSEDLSRQVRGVLMGRLGGLDPLELRILERRLSSACRSDGSTEGTAVGIRDIWARFAASPADGIFADFPEMEPLAKALQSSRLAISRGKTAAQVLWEIWQAFDVAEKWREIALGSGVLADQANADLDAVIQLFRVAQRLEERDIRTATIETLLSHLAAQDLPEDSVARGGSIPDAITLATPASTVGRTWKHVIIMGLNEGVWPNTRLRNPLTHVPELVSVVVNALVNGDANVPSSQLRAEVVGDELRLLLQSASRAQESLIFTCIHSRDVQPSRFLRWLDQREEVPLSLLPAPQTARVLGATALVGHLRQALAVGEEPAQETAQTLLDLLAEHGVRGADQRWWIDQLSVPQQAVHGEEARHPLADKTGRKSNPSARGASARRVSVSPSAVDSMLSCPLQGFLSSIGGDDVDRFASADVGTLIHSIAQHHPHGSEDEMLAELKQRWSELNLAPGTIADRAEYAAAQHMIAVLAAYQQQAPRGVLVEKSAHGMLEGIAVHARLDRLEFDPNAPTEFLVSDIKTGKYPPTKAQTAEHPQLLIYQWLVDQQGIDVGSADERGNLVPSTEAESLRESESLAESNDLAESESAVLEALTRGQQMHSRGAQLIYVRNEVKKKLPVYVQEESGASECDQAQRMIRATAELLSSDEFPALVHEPLCRRCAYQAMCPAQEGRRIFS